MCRNIKLPRFGSLSCSEESDVYNPGTVCNIECRRGFKLNGHPSAVCSSNGTWITSNATCIRTEIQFLKCEINRIFFVALPCPSLIPPEHGYFIPAGCSAGTSPLYHHCIVACDKGYRIQGRAVLTCMSSQEWNREVPRCVKRK